MLAKFTQCLDLPAREIERRIAKYFDLDVRQVHAKYIGRLLPTQEGEKIVEIRVDEPALSNEELLRAMGIIEGDRMTWTTDGTAKSLSENLARKEPAMAEEKLTSSEQAAQQKQFASFIEMMKNVLGLDKIVEWLKAQVLELIDSARKTVAEYEIKVKEQDKKISDLIEAKNKAEENAVQIKASEDTRYKQLLDRIAKMEGKINSAAATTEILAKNLKG